MPSCRSKSRFRNIMEFIEWGTKPVEFVEGALTRPTTSTSNKVVERCDSDYIAAWREDHEDSKVRE